jgi:hypothetical protein
VNRPPPRHLAPRTIARSQRSEEAPAERTRFYRTVLALLGIVASGLLAVGLVAAARSRPRVEVTAAEPLAVAPGHEGQGRAVEPRPLALRRGVAGGAQFVSASPEHQRTNDDPAPPTTHDEIVAMILKERSEKLARVDATVATGKQWHDRLRDKREQWRRDLPATLREKVNWSAMTCRAGGCYWEMRAANPAVEQEFGSWLTDQADFVGWPGERFKSGTVENTDGTLSVTWIFFSPEAATGPQGARK